MIRLIDFLQLAGVGIDTSNRSLKIHLACWTGVEHPIDVYYSGRFKEWQERQNQRNFQSIQALGLIDMGQSNWLFAGVYMILDCQERPDGGYRYSTELLPGQEELIGRVMVFHKRHRASYIWYTDDTPLPITEILSKKLVIGEFPGYNAIEITHAKLRIITQQKIASWHGALANIKGVYLILDTKTGKHYVGKASGNEGIWQRWYNYADNGHGGNKTLKKLLKDNGKEYMKNFKYSILEIADTHASEQDIQARESYWMTVLGTREFGLNN